MKYLSTLLLCLLFSAGLTHAQDKKARPSVKALDEKYGFREAKFEADTTQFQDLVLVEKGKDTRFYSRTGDAKTIGGAEVESIYYGFYKGKLSVVALQTRGLSNSQALLDALRTQYGAGSQANQYIRDYSWYGQKVIMSFDENSASRDAKVYMFSRPMMEVEKADKKAAASKASSDL